MAKIVESKIVIKVSEMIKDDVDSEAPLSDDVITALEEVISELVGKNKLVEIVKE